MGIRLLNLLLVIGISSRARPLRRRLLGLWDDDRGLESSLSVLIYVSPSMHSFWLNFYDI
jgi:hypothetical protein